MNEKFSIFDFELLSYNIKKEANPQWEGLRK